ncbi:endonuclease/exonuclease/phosphatase family protein [Marivita sp. GX14005]|uniref:endonuclease/exonuclease/phosphatase family protein n=1 Tax=Marivita sp. GX14005 TaxID=2942276 RepID=UPI002018A398|nr:endonuclease/exonuclease/phosphatase family protein [Marivita sp. GX14005]MCL3881676.1 endonuclease/exonuclease/phosphatase family protein [Marivita sp. GX14005]
MAQELRLALWHVPLTRDGPGLLLRDIVRQQEPLPAFAQALARADADIIVLTKFDFDAGGAALDAFAWLIGGGYHTLALRPNAGLPTGHDMDGDGRLAEPEDAQAYGRFPGQEGMAVLSRIPIASKDVRSFNDMLWRDLPGTHIAPNDAGLDVQRLSSGGHWVVPIHVESAPLHLLVGHSGAPVFDGPEDRNGRRNLDELRLWEHILDGGRGPPMPEPFVLMANTNLDPQRGEGYRDAMALFLQRPDLQDPLPGQVTAHWDDPGPMRVSYLLPSKGFQIRHAEVLPPLEGQDHSLIIVDIALPERRPP